MFNDCWLLKFQWLIYKSITTDATCEAGNAYPFWAPDFTPDFNWVHVARFLVFCVMFCRLLFIYLSFFLLAIVLSIYGFGLPVLVSSNSSYNHIEDENKFNNAWKLNRKEAGIGKPGQLLFPTTGKAWELGRQETFRLVMRIGLLKSTKHYTEH